LYQRKGEFLDIFEDSIRVGRAEIMREGIITIGTIIIFDIMKSF